jgi:hypothetical protein
MKSNTFIATIVMVLGLTVILSIRVRNGRAASTAQYGQQGCVSAPDGFLGWWPANGNALDLWGGNHGSLQNGATYASGMVGQAFSLDGINDSVQVPDSEFWAFGASDFTIDLWANFNSDPGGTVGNPGVIFLDNDEGPGTTNKWVFGLGGGVLVFHVNGPATPSVFLVQAPFVPVLNQWYHIAVTRSGDAFSIYIDGTLAGSESSSVVIPNPNAPLMIGQAEDLFYTDGRLDELHIFDRALSTIEIQAIFDAGIAGICLERIHLPIIISDNG